MRNIPRTCSFLILSFLPACSPKEQTPVTTAGTLEQTQTPTQAEAFTYYSSIKGIIDTRCVGCHRTGGLAPFSLEESSTVTRLHRSIAAATQSRRMPPWMAAKDCQDYSNDRSLRDEEISNIARWSQAGAPLGDPADYVAPPKPSQGLSRVDREIMPSEAYAPKPDTNDYRCFVIDWPETNTQYITGFGVMPGRPELVHHVIAYRVPPTKIAAVEALDAAEEGPGYTCFGGPLSGGASLPEIALWAPGSLGRDLPASTGLKMESGSKVVMQVHYHTEHEHGTPAADRSKLLFKLDPQVAEEAYVVPFTNNDWRQNHSMHIPAGQSGVKHSYSASFSDYVGRVTEGRIPANMPLQIHDAALHMHLLGQTTSLQLERSDSSSTCLLNIPRWDFHWQGSYVFKQSITVNPGERMKLECIFDNPGPKDVNWGEGTEDEMCIGFVYVSR